MHSYTHAHTYRSIYLQIDRYLYISSSAIAALLLLSQNACIHIHADMHAHTRTHTSLYLQIDRYPSTYIQPRHCCSAVTQSIHIHANMHTHTRTPRATNRLHPPCRFLFPSRIAVQQTHHPLHERTHFPTFLYIHIYLSIYLYIYLQISISMSIYAYLKLLYDRVRCIRMHTHTRRHACTHTHAHTHLSIYLQITIYRYLYLYIYIPLEHRKRPVVPTQFIRTSSSRNAETADVVCGSMGLVLSIYRVYRYTYLELLYDSIARAPPQLLCC